MKVLKKHLDESNEELDDSNLLPLECGHSQDNILLSSSNQVYCQACLEEMLTGYIKDLFEPQEVINSDERVSFEDIRKEVLSRIDIPSHVATDEQIDTLEF